MNNVIIAIYRNELNYLIKYNSIRISSERIINFSFPLFNEIPEQQKVSILQNSVPLYEQEHEVVLLEYNTGLISYNIAPTLEFNGISSIIPLTETGASLISSKLNTDFKISSPLNAKLYKAFVNNRSNILRFQAGKKLCFFYNLAIPSKEFIHDFKEATLFQLNGKKPEEKDSTLAHLIDFNVTPSFIPEGNIEALIKSACVGMKKLNKKVDLLTKGAVYKLLIHEQNAINNQSLFQALNFLEAKAGIDEAFKTGFDTLKNTLSENRKYKNAFQLFSFFYYLKKAIEKSDYDISSAQEDILELIYFDAEIASKVLFMLGYTFSIHTISKSFQSYSNSELLKTKKNIDLEWKPNAVDDLQDNLDQDQSPKKDIENLEDNISNQKTDEKEYEKPIEVELSIEKDIKSFESKINNDLDTPNVGLFSVDSEVKSPSMISNTIKIDFEDYKLKLGKNRDSKNLITAIEVKLKDDLKVSKDIVIDCLIEINKYKKQKGNLYSIATKALEAFQKEE